MRGFFFSDLTLGYAALGVALLLNIGLWAYSQKTIPIWANVPPAPSQTAVTMSFLGDRELAYRSTALTLQAFGNTTGQFQALKDFNYDHLGTWFFLADSLDNHSNYVPTLAAYYYGASQDSSKLMPLIVYLRHVGQQDGDGKWQYLGQAIYLARHKMNDMPLALDLADDLAKAYKPGMPGWVLQMKAIISSDMGDKTLAYSLMLETIKSQGDTLDPVEVNFMLDYMCNKILSPQEKRLDPVCHDVK